MPVYELQTPERLHFQTDHQTWYGFCQDWYRDDFQQKAGCGPTTATYMLAYCLVRDGIWNVNDQIDALAYMETIWTYVKPTYGGLFKTRWLRDGVRQYLADQKIRDYRIHMMTVPAFSVYRPSGEEVLSFLQQGLQADSPICFLNRHRGSETELETWHWVPLVRLSRTTDTNIAWCYDEGKVRQFVPERWVQNTILGGGFVYMEKIK